MFGALFGRASAGQESQHHDREMESSSEVEQLLDLILDPRTEPTERRANAYTLRELMGSERRDLSKAYASGIVRRIDSFQTALQDPENEEVAQTLLEILGGSAERGHSILLKTVDVINALMDAAQNSTFVWVRVCAIQALQSLTAAAPNETVEHLQSISSALERLVGFLSDENLDVRNEMIVLLHKLTECSEQFRKYMTFCDAPSVLLKIALEEKETIVSSDCLAVCLNTLQGNPIGQKLFVETPEFLKVLPVLLHFESDAQDPTSAMLRVGKCVELIRILIHGRVESNNALIRDVVPVISNDDKRQLNVKEAQTKLGLVPKLIENLFMVASDNTASVEDSSKREAMYTLGDLVCQHSRNAAALERLKGFSFLVSTALTSARWPDAKAAAYAWICALDGLKEGEQRALTLLGHAVAPLPESFDDSDEATNGDDRIDDAASLVANSVYRSVQSILTLRDEVYVDLSRVSERKSTTWRAMNLWEHLLLSASAKELALKVMTDSHPLIDVLCQCVKDLLITKDETDAVKDLVEDTCAGLLRLLITWVSGSRESAEHLLSSTANLFLFEPLQSQDSRLVQLGALLVAACLISTWDPKEKCLAYGFIENKWGESNFFRILKHSWQERISEFKSDWSAEECASVIVDSEFALFAERTVAQADSIFVRASSSRPSKASENHPNHVPAANGQQNQQRSLMATDAEVGQLSSDLAFKLKKLEQDYAQLLVILAHQELERQSLLQTIQDLGGKNALDDALQRSATLLTKAFESYDANQEE